MLDPVDRKLLLLIQKNCKLSYAELGSQVGLSVSSVNERLKKLLVQGTIRHYVAVVNPGAMGLGLMAFIQVSVDRPQHESAFLKRIEKLPEVQECHHITGDFSYLLKVRTRSTAHLERLIKEKLKSLEGVVRTHTLIVLSTFKETTALGFDERMD